MSLTLDFNGQLLIADIGNVDIEFDSGLKILATVAIKPTKKIPHTLPDPDAAGKLGFFVRIQDLPIALQTQIRDDINKEQKKIHDATLTSKERLTSPRVPLVDIPRDYPLLIKTTNTWNKHPSLRVGEEIAVRPRAPFKNLEFTLGTITGFTIR